MVFLLVALLVIFSVSCVNSDICAKNVSGTIVGFCCNNSERKGLQCIECSDGFTSKDEEPCKPCPEGLFGRKCRGSCESCNENQRCNFTIGCVDLYQTPESSSELSTGSVEITFTTGSTKEIAVEEVTIYSITALVVTTLVSSCLLGLCLARCRSCVLKIRTNKRKQRQTHTGNIYSDAIEMH